MPNSLTNICLTNRLIINDVTYDWAELLADADVLLGPPVQFAKLRVVFVVVNVRMAMTVLVYGIMHDLDWGVIEVQRLSELLKIHFFEAGITLIYIGVNITIRRVKRNEPAIPGRVTVLTSGTTGILKLVEHTPATLNTYDKVQSLPANVWFVPYQIGSYAWYQLMTLSLLVPSQDLIPGDFADLTGSFENALHKGEVTAVSSTPTFWRHALMSVDEKLLSQAPIRSVSLGGEIVDQPILDRLAAMYPEARIRHIYASSEAGAAIVVSDGRAGFDSNLLDVATRTIGLTIKDGHLYVRSPYVNAQASGTWIDTGDLVEAREGRVYFCGRAENAVINVGGQKAFPSDIESHLMGHPNVIWAQVTAQRAPVVGYLPVASIVLREPMEVELAEMLLTAYCQERLPNFAVPRLWDFLDNVPLRASLKT